MPSFREGLSFDDILLIPKRTSVLPSEVDLSTAFEGKARPKRNAWGSTAGTLRAQTGALRCRPFEPGMIEGAKNMLVIASP